MQYLNRVHFNSPMAPLELEIYHQMRNVIGIDPTFYEYIFTVDADTVSTVLGQVDDCLWRDVAGRHASVTEQARRCFYQ